MTDNPLIPVADGPCAECGAFEYHRPTCSIFPLRSSIHVRVPEEEESDRAPWGFLVIKDGQQVNVPVEHRQAAEYIRDQLAHGGFIVVLDEPYIPPRSAFTCGGCAVSFPLAALALTDRAGDEWCKPCAEKMAAEAEVTPDADDADFMFYVDTDLCPRCGEQAISRMRDDELPYQCDACGLRFGPRPTDTTNGVLAAAQRAAAAPEAVLGVVPVDSNHCRWCGAELTFEDDGDAENGPHLFAYCDNDDCPGDPNDPQPPDGWHDYDPAEDADSELVANPPEEPLTVTPTHGQS
jgi:predicted RNA-binding Zn-ribbon protein involved in translation (DUF1610 family)